MMSRRFVLVLAFVLSVFGSSVGSASADVDPQLAKDMVTKLATQAVEVMVGKNIPDQDRIARFRALFIASVDMPNVSRFILGRHWKTASPDQQTEFMKLFEDMLVYTWASRFKEASDKIAVNVVGVKADGDTGAIVESQILREGQEPTPVLWRLRQSDAGLRISDLMIEGTSMIVTYREEYASVISQNNGTLTGLLDILRKKTEAMAQQSMVKTTHP
jgi:phospholipid transport system substrate-binding protein